MSVYQDGCRQSDIDESVQDPPDVERCLECGAIPQDPCEDWCACPLCATDESEIDRVEDFDLHEFTLKETR